MSIIRKIVWVILFVFFNGCTNSFENGDSNSTMINNIYFNYEGSENKIYVSCDLFNAPENINDHSIVFELYQSSNVVLENSLSRQINNGESEIVSYWGSFSIDEIEQNKFYFLKVFLLDENNLILSSSYSASKILGNTPPEILSYDVPNSFKLDPADWQDLTIKLFFCDSDGWADLVSAQYYFKRNWSCSDGTNEINDDEYNQGDSPQNCQMAINPSNLNSPDCIYELNAILKMRPLDGSALIENGEEVSAASPCGRIGETLFKFEIEDSKGQKSFIENIKMIITE